MTPPAPGFVDFFAGSGVGGRTVFENAKDTVGWIGRLAFLQAAGAFVLTGDATLAVS